MATISKEKSYMVYNTSSSPLCLSTRYESFLIEGGSPESPTGIPLSLDEILIINSRSPVFKIGAAWFDEEDAEEIYTALRIHNWRDILTDREIEAILRNPTTESLQRIIDIDNIAYFERVRGMFTYLQNIGAQMSMQVQKVVKTRYKELQQRKTTSSIRVVPHEDPQQAAARADEVNDLKRQLEEMQRMLAGFMAQSAAADEPVETKAAPKPAAKTTRKKPTEEDTEA